MKYPLPNRAKELLAMKRDRLRIKYRSPHESDDHLNSASLSKRTAD